jgi:hypothetical protein
MAGKYGPMGKEKTDGAVFKGDYLSGEDAAYIKPKLIPDYELLPRDDSGGPEWQPYSAEFGDGGYVIGNKAHLMARGGEDDPMGEDGDEQDEQNRKTAAKEEALGKTSVKQGKTPKSSRKLEKE